jgi:hypothetical protein
MLGRDDNIPHYLVTVHIKCHGCNDKKINVESIPIVKTSTD